MAQVPARRAPVVVFGILCDPCCALCGPSRVLVCDFFEKNKFFFCGILRNARCVLCGPSSVLVLREYRCRISLV